ncbi:aspartic proteinase CDR1-like [Vitis riparia]|uniref:aspartic proteinase CDR1-like n=1 Tax=Vitis riparia TaxID=96939 RepID=UPI00155AC00A|nr:aspartic proteinase CDR1-like [Vitis riparia]
MATTSIFVHTFFHSLFFTILLSVSVTSTTTTAMTDTKPLRLVTGLIHQDSILSSYQSLDRNNVERRRTRRAAFITDEIQANMVADDRGQAFLVNFSIGRPPVPQLVGIDTGSDLLWVQCHPCADCFRQSTPIFDPSKSSTYVDLSYDSPICPNSPQKKYNHLNQCIYNASYADGSTSSGNLATEDIVFETSDQGTVTVSSVVFGCGRSNRGRFDGQQSGILGLSAGDQSIVSRLGSRFSYCIGDLFDPHYTHNQLVLGDGVKMEGSSTPFHTFNGFYYVTLEGISVGETRLDINPEVFQRTESGQGGVVMDSGTTATFLAKDGFDPLSNEIQKLVRGHFQQVIYRTIPGWLCYKGRVNEDLRGFPELTFHFAEGADLVLDANSLFVQKNQDVFCLAVLESNLKNIGSVIGIMAQQHYNVAYDLIGKRVYFQRIDCELLED